MMRWLVTGADGMLGRDLRDRLAAEQVTHTDRDTLDITDARAVVDAVKGFDVVVNCAAWTDVDGAETSEAAAMALNAHGPRNLAQACREAGARLVHLSTDYVFSGDATSPYDEDAPCDPASAYGRTKAAGEAAVRRELPEGRHLLVRTAWLYGEHGRCFPTTIARLASSRGAVSVVDDQVGQPTWTHDVADRLVRLVQRGAAGTFQVTSSGSTTWWGFAREVVATAGLDPAIVSPTTTEAFSRPAPRPAYSVLSNRRLAELGIEPIGDWRTRWSVAATRVLSGQP